MPNTMMAGKLNTTPCCNLERLVEFLQRENLRVLVAYYAPHVTYLSGFNSAAGYGRFEADSEAALVLSREDPLHPILLVADGQLGATLTTSGWVGDIRSFNSVMRQQDVLPENWLIDRFVPQGIQQTQSEQLRSTYERSLDSAVLRAMHDLDLIHGRIGFDHPWLARRIATEQIEAVDAFTLLRNVRSVKTRGEIERLRNAALLNEQALQLTMQAWQTGATYGDLGRIYQHAVVDLNGYLDGTHPFVLANPAGGESAFLTTSPSDLNQEVKSGHRIMFDCHGKLDQYCWDGGKTWIVGGPRNGRDSAVAAATAESMSETRASMRPGVSRATLQAAGRSVLKRHGIINSDAALIFFHGVGLDHGDIEIPAYGSGKDWVLETGMVVATHFYLPGDEHQRYWLEDVAVVEADGGRSLYSWGLGPHTC